MIENANKETLNNRYSRRISVRYNWYNCIYFPEILIRFPENLALFPIALFPIALFPIALFAIALFVSSSEDQKPPYSGMIPWRSSTTIITTL